MDSILSQMTVFCGNICVGVHLTDEGTNIFAANIVDYIRHFILKEFWNEAACNDKHFEDQYRDIDKGSP